MEFDWSNQSFVDIDGRIGYANEVYLLESMNYATNEAARVQQFGTALKEDSRQAVEVRQKYRQMRGDAPHIPSRVPVVQNPQGSGRRYNRGPHGETRPDADIPHFSFSGKKK